MDGRLESESVRRLFGKYVLLVRDGSGNVIDCSPDFMKHAVSEHIGFLCALAVGMYNIILRRPQSRRKPNRQLELHVLGIWHGFLVHLHVRRLSRLILDKIPCVGSILFLGQLFLLCVLNWRLQCRSCASSTHLLPVLLRRHVCSDLGLLRRVLVQSPARKLAESLSDQECLINSQLQLLVQRQ